MTIEQTDKIDFVSVSDAGELTLSISDHLDWEDSGRHLVLLQDKLNAYLRFIESGELGEKFPHAVGKPIIINLVAKFDLSKQGSSLIAQAREVLSAAGYELRIEMLRPN
jgi:hypothetical protein